MATQCIFCNGHPLIKEDAWPQWLVTLVGRDRISCTVWQGDSIQRRFPTKGIVQRVVCVCAACNNGWMSQLESTAKPILAPLVDGIATTLTLRCR